MTEVQTVRRSRPIRFAIVVVAVATLVVTLAMPPAGQAQLACMTGCMGSPGAGMTCTVTAYCAMGYGAMTINTESITTAVSAGCTLGGLDLMAVAMHSAGQASTATCGFMFSAVCCGTAFCGVGSTVMTTCTVNATDGLPVELMEFSVDEEDEADGGASSGDPDPKE